MYIQILKNYILGYVKVQIEGYFIERVMNLCLNKRILLWHSKRKKATLLEANISMKDFKMLTKLVKQSKCKVKIKQKKGLPFLFNKYKKRKIFFLLLAFILVGILILSNFVWNIEIVGNESIPEEELVQSLKEDGLSIGSLKNKIDTKEIVNKMRLNRNDLAWIGIEIEGTNAIVKVVEAKQKPEIIEEDEYCNIVAKKAGRIVKVNAINGTPLVKEGDVITQNMPLIGGWLEGKYTGIRYVHANGTVQAKVWYTKKEKVELKQIRLTKTENKETKYSVKINNFTINFYKTLSKFEKYDTIEENKKLKLFSNFYLPLELIKKTNIEQIEQEINYTKEEAKQQAIDKAKEKVEEEIEAKENILNTYINCNETTEYVEAQVTYEVLEEIGTKEKIVF